MAVAERRQTKRLIMRVPMHVRSLRENAKPEQSVISMNISIHGAYFAIDEKLQLEERVEVRLMMPEQIIMGQTTEWCFTGRVAHVDRLGPNGKCGVGVQFFYYTAGEKKADFPAQPERKV